MGYLFFSDTTVVINFALCDEMDLLATIVEGRGAWTGAVQAECHQKSDEFDLPRMREADDIFGQPFRPENGAEHLMVHTVRQNFLRPGDGPRKHLGESESLAILSTRSGLKGAFVTDDMQVHAPALTQYHVQCLTTWDLLRVALITGWATEQTIRDMRSVLLEEKRVHVPEIRDEARFELWLTSAKEQRACGSHE